MRGGSYVYGLYQLRGTQAIYLDQAVSPSAQEYKVGQIFQGAKVVKVTAGVNLQMPNFDFVVMLESATDPSAEKIVAP